MRDQVSWGFYIANFTFLVGVAAAAVLLVIPAYIYHFEAHQGDRRCSASCWPSRPSSCACSSSPSTWDSPTGSGTSCPSSAA
ncbi:MAG: polysulfide reductase NrfD [Desulfomicrobium escambiense]|nr:polysulfide reductase NrfD [Desulfomicrobium escambiense]